MRSTCGCDTPYQVPGYYLLTLSCLTLVRAYLCGASCNMLAQMKSGHIISFTNRSPFSVCLYPSLEAANIQFKGIAGVACLVRVSLASNVRA